MRKIAVFLTKGGVGKTTTAIHIAAGLANRGAKVLLIDTDTQGHAAPMLGVTPTASLAQVLTNDLAAEKTIISARERLWLLAGGGELADVKRRLSHQGAAAEHCFGQALAPLEGQYDYVIVDTAPGWDILNVSILLYVHDILAPVSLEVLSLKSLVEFSKSIAPLHTQNPALSMKYILPTFLDGRVKKSQEILDQLQAHYGPRLCPAVRYSVRISEAPGYGQTIYEYAPNSPGAIDYQHVTEQIAK